MANFSVIGFIDAIKYLPNNGGCLIFLSEFKKGYKKSSGEVVEDRYMQWKCIFKQGLVKYVTNHFNKGMLVEIKGEVFPYAIEHGSTVDGYSVVAQTLNMYSYPRYHAKSEDVMIKESQRTFDEIPDVEGYNQPDF